MATPARTTPPSSRAEASAIPRPPWTPRTIWRRAREVVHEQGWKSLWFKVLGETVYRRAWVAVRPLNRIDFSRRRPAGVEIRELTEEALDTYVELHPAADREAVGARLAAGERCFLALSGGRPVHSSWIASGSAYIPYLERTVALAPDEAYFGESFTVAEARRKGIGTMTLVEIARRLRSEACSRFVSVIMPENRLGDTATWRWDKNAVMRTVWLGPWRLELGAFPPAPGGARADDSWSRALVRVERRGHYLDPFLGELKRAAHLRLLREWGRLRSDGRLLKTDLFEEAVGPDAFLAELPPAVGEAVGIDLSPAVVQRARLRAAGAPIRWVAADVRELPFREGSFATIVSTSTLDHFARPADLGRSLRELRCLLEPGGRLVVTLDNRSNLFDPLLRLACRLRLVPYFVGRSYTVRETRRELADAGFEVVETTAILHNPRLVAVGTMRLARLARVRAVATAVERLLLAAQRLEGTQLRYLTGSFVAACARRPAATAQEPTSVASEA